VRGVFHEIIVIAQAFLAAATHLSCTGIAAERYSAHPDRGVLGSSTTQSTQATSHVTDTFGLVWLGQDIARASPELRGLVQGGRRGSAVSEMSKTLSRVARSAESGLIVHLIEVSGGFHEQIDDAPAGYELGPLHLLSAEDADRLVRWESIVILQNRGTIMVVTNAESDDDFEAAAAAADGRRPAVATGTREGLEELQVLIQKVKLFQQERGIAAPRTSWDSAGYVFVVAFQGSSRWATGSPRSDDVHIADLLASATALSSKVRGQAVSR
jgi:hypothetical protein